jgi:hypothetical protein
MAFDKDLSKDDFITKLGAKKGSYAANLLSQIYDTLKDKSDDVKTNYERYHKKEYDTFEDYLQNNKNFRQETIEKIMSEYKNGKAVLIGSFSNESGDPLESFLCTEDFIIDENGIFVDGLENGW